MKTMSIVSTSMRTTKLYHTKKDTDMKESAIAQLLQNCDIIETKLVINVENADSVKKEISLKDSEDFMNDLVKKGTIVNLVFSNWKIYTGIFDSLEDEDGEYVLYLKPRSSASYGVGLAYDKLVGYYLD